MKLIHYRWRILRVMAFAIGTIATAFASSSYLTQFVNTYPATSSSQLNSCLLCHTTAAGGGSRNAYGTDFANNGHNFKNIEALDSDKDGFTNIAEITALTFPGDAASHPAGPADTTPPTVTAFTMPSTAGTLTVTINLLSASDNTGVTGFLVTESSTSPSASAAGWSASPPSSYTFAAAGVRTAYAYAKDAAGNVSASRSATVTITLPSGTDTTPPTVTAFSLPATASSLTVSITTLTATDNVGVAGYLVTESSTSPASAATGWSASKPTSYVFASAGTKTLFAWAKDAAGNVSASRSASTTIALAPPSNAPKSITSTSQNRSSQASTQVGEQPRTQSTGYQVFASNDLGMHCADLDQRVASILPPFNVLHAQVVKKGHVPQILDQTQVEVVYSAASNPNDPALLNPLPSNVYKSNFWDKNWTGNPLAFDAFNPYYPPNILSAFALVPDVGLPVPDLQRLYFGDGKLVADQQGMPSATSRWVTRPYSMNVPQPFALYYKNLPFFVKFLFGYSLTGVNWFSAEGIPISPFDDAGRLNSFPLMRVQARAVSGNTQGLSAGTVISSLDTVVPVSGEVDCRNCHAAPADGGNGSATGALGANVMLARQDPQYGRVPLAVSLEYAFDVNILRLHDLRNGTNLQASTPVSCQKCHYTPALDLAHVGPADVNGRQQTTHQSFSRVMHSFHGSLGMFPAMPSPAGRTIATRDGILTQTCYQCHPGRVTQCFRGEMFNAGQACQDCHGNMQQVGNDFSRDVSRMSPGKFIVAGDYYTNASTPRVPWANEPMCQSCHTGDANQNLASAANVVKGGDGMRLIQAYRTGDANAKPIVATNRRFAENQSGSKQVLYRLSRGHGGVFCEGCHGATHAEWPIATANANDNIAATQIQGHAGKIVECQACHGANTFTTSDFRGNFDTNGWMKGPHGMHPVDQNWISGHYSVFRDSATPSGTCQACHGTSLQGTVLSRTAADRTYRIDDGRTRVIPKGTPVSCTLCHGNPLNGGDD